MRLNLTGRLHSSTCLSFVVLRDHADAILPSAFEAHWASVP